MHRVMLAFDEPLAMQPDCPPKDYAAALFINLSANIQIALFWECPRLGSHINKDGCGRRYRCAKIPDHTMN